MVAPRAVVWIRRVYTRVNTGVGALIMIIITIQGPDLCGILIGKNIPFWVCTRGKSPMKGWDYDPVVRIRGRGQ